MPLRVLALTLVLTFVRLRAAAADDALTKPTSASALQHFEEGKKHFFNREWKDAVDEFKAGARDQSLPIFDFNLAQTYRQLGDFDAAIWHYEHFLQAHPAADHFRTTAEKNLAEMKDKRAQAKATSLPTATNATPVPAPPLPPPVLEKWWEDWFAWGLLGTGVVGMGVGGGFLLSASDLDGQANHTSNQLDANALHDRAGTRSLLGAAIGIGGAALTITGAFKLAIYPHADQNTSVGLGVSTNGLFVFGRF